MPPSEPKEPVVETPADRDSEADLDGRALRARVRQQEILAELGVAALRGTPFTQLLDEVARLSAEGLEAEYCKVLEYLPSENRLLMRAGVGWHPGLVGVATIGADLDSPSGYALRTGKPVISNHLDVEERFRTPELLAAHGVRRAMNVILQGDGTPYGVLEVDSKSEGEFTIHDIAFLQGAANILGMAIERQRRERDLTAALERQKVLVKEINHRVKNSLQLVASMLNMQSGNGESAAALQLQDAARRIMAIGRAHDRLYRSPQIEQIELEGYLSDICLDLKDVTPNCEVDFQASGPMFLNTDRAIALALVLTELVANAAKHAYPGETNGRIQVGLTRSGNLIRISVGDQGVGLPADFESREGGTGLGMRLARALTKQAGARFEFKRLAPGSEFVVEVPANPDSPPASD